MTLLELQNKVKDGKIFTATFIKKDGTRRVMNCRLGVKKHLKGGELKYDAKGRGYLPVFDVQKGGYRMINVNTLEKVTIKGETFYEKETMGLVAE